MKKALLPLVLAAIALVPLLAFAQDGGGLGAAAPFVNDETLGIVRVDLKKLDLPAALKSITSTIPKELLVGADLKDMEEKGGGIIKALTDNGVNEAFAIVSSLDLRRPHESFFIVLPVAKGKDPQDVIDAVSKVAGGPPPHELPI